MRNAVSPTPQAKCRAKPFAVLACAALTSLGWFSLAPGARAQTYDSSADFSSTTNPNGAWTYGWSKELTSFLHVFGNPFLFHGIQGWADSAIPMAVAPQFCFNPGPRVNGGYPPQTTAMRPGQHGEFCHCLWTASETGVYEVKVSLTALSNGSPHAYVLKNGVTIDDSVLDMGIAHSFESDSMSLWGGDRIEAVVGLGKIKNFAADDTQFSLVIRKVQ